MSVAAGDNAAMESFFALLQKNVLDTRLDSRHELRLAIIVLDRDQIQPPTPPTSPRRLTPVEFEMIYPAAQAANHCTHPERQPDRGRPNCSRSLRLSQGFVRFSVKRSLSMARSIVIVTCGSSPALTESST